MPEDEIMPDEPEHTVVESSARSCGLVEFHELEKLRVSDVLRAKYLAQQGIISGSAKGDTPFLVAHLSSAPKTKLCNPRSGRCGLQAEGTKHTAQPAMRWHQQHHFLFVAPLTE